MRRTVPLNAPTNVAAGSTATFSLPVDRRYHAVWIAYKSGASPTYATKATIESEISKIEVKLNGVVQRSFTPAQLHAMLLYYGFKLTDGLIPILFSEPWRRSTAGEDALAWQLRGQVSTFQIDIEIASGVTNPTLEGFMEVDNIDRDQNDRPLPLLAIKKTFNQVLPVVATGDFTFTSLPAQDSYFALHLFETADGDITAAKVKLNEFEVYNLKRQEHIALAKKHGGAHQTGVWSLNFDHTFRSGDSLALRGPQRQALESRVDLTMGAANPVTMIAEAFGPPNGIAR